MTNTPDRMLSWPEVKKVVGLSRPTVWRMKRKGDFPPSVQLSPGRVGWFESSITAWLETRRTGGHGSQEAPAAPNNVTPFSPR